MNTQRKCEYCSNSFAAKEKKNERPKLRVIQGDLFHTLRNAQRIENFFSFCHSLFWSEQNFSEEQKMEYHTLIAEHFSNEEHGDTTFIELVERAILAKRYVSANSDRFIPQPQFWLDKDCPFGLTGTKAWHERIEKKRKFLPLYNIGVSILAEAIFDLYKNGDVKAVNLYREYFYTSKQTDLFQIYINTIIHSQYLEL